MEELRFVTLDEVPATASRFLSLFLFNCIIPSSLVSDRQEFSYVSVSLSLSLSLSLLLSFHFPWILKRSVRYLRA